MFTTWKNTPAGFGPADGQQPDVIDHQDRGCGEGLRIRGEVALDGDTDQSATEVVGGGEVAAVAGLDGQGCDGHREVCLAAAGLSEKQDGPVLVDEPQGREVLDEFAVNGGLELVVEVIDGAPERELGVAQPGSETPVPVGGGLLGDELGEELDVGPLFGELAKNAEVLMPSRLKRSRCGAGRSESDSRG